MKQELNDNNMEHVVGGSVVVSGNQNVVVFTTLKKKRALVNCDSDDAIMLATQMYMQYKNSGNLAYETAVMDAFRANGWIQ